MIIYLQCIHVLLMIHRILLCIHTTIVTEINLIQVCSLTAKHLQKAIQVKLVMCTLKKKKKKTIQIKEPWAKHKAADSLTTNQLVLTAQQAKKTKTGCKGVTEQQVWTWRRTLTQRIKPCTLHQPTGHFFETRSDETGWEGWWGCDLDLKSQSMSVQG